MEVYQREKNEIQKRLFTQLLELLLQRKLISREEKEQLTLQISSKVD